MTDYCVQNKYMYNEMTSLFARQDNTCTRMCSKPLSFLRRGKKEVFTWVPDNGLKCNSKISGYLSCYVISIQR